MLWRTKGRTHLTLPPPTSLGQRASSPWAAGPSRGRDACTLLLTPLDWIPLLGVSRGAVNKHVRTTGVHQSHRANWVSAQACSVWTQEADPSPVMGWAIQGLVTQGTEYVLLFRGPTLGMIGPE